MKCARCGATVIAVGITCEGRFFCTTACCERLLVDLSRSIPLEQIEQRVRDIHEGTCPKCGGPGPVDMHMAYTAVSYVVHTRTACEGQLSCRRCGAEFQLHALLKTGLGGSWHFPWGPIFTPVQLLRNLGGMRRGPNPRRPSAALDHVARAEFGSAILARSRFGRFGEGIPPIPECRAAPHKLSRRAWAAVAALLVLDVLLVYPDWLVFAGAVAQAPGQSSNRIGAVELGTLAGPVAILLAIASFWVVARGIRSVPTLVCAGLVLASLANMLLYAMGMLFGLDLAE